MSHETGHPPLARGGAPQPPPLAATARTKEPGEAPRIWDDPRNVQRFVYAFYSACVVLVLLDLVIHRHVAHPWERLFGFHAWYGFAACWMLVVIAKQMRRVLMRSEDYYDGD
jgi:hypothetical protein